MINNINDPQTFPELNFEHLQGYAEDWTAWGVCKGLPILRIVLCRYSPRFQMYSRTTIPTKFAVVFEFFNTDIYTDFVFNEALPHRFESVKENIEHIKNEGNDSAEVKKYKEFVRHTQFYQTGKKTYNAFFNASFPTTVYRVASSSDDYRHEWTLIPKPPADDTPIGVRMDVPHWVLWSEASQRTEHPVREKIALCEEGFLPPQTKIIDSQRNEWQTNVAKWATKNGFIAVADLVCILAFDETYNELLNDIWKDFQMDLEGDECPDQSTYGSRIDIWTSLLWRWTHNEILGVNLKNQRLYGTQGRIREDRVLYYEVRDSGVHIQLDELKRHFSELVGVPVPELLFSKSPELVSTLDNQDDTDSLVLHHGLAAQRLYDCMVSRLKGHLRKNITNSTAEERQQAAVGAFDADPDGFSPLRREQVDAPGPYEDDEKQRRKVIGCIIMLSSIRGAESNYQALYSRFQRLKCSK